MGTCPGPKECFHLEKGHCPLLFPREKKSMPVMISVRKRLPCYHFVAKSFCPDIFFKKVFFPSFFRKQKCLPPVVLPSVCSNKFCSLSLPQRKAGERFSEKSLEKLNIAFLFCSVNFHVQTSVSHKPVSYEKSVPGGMLPGHLRTQYPQTRNLRGFESNPESNSTPVEVSETICLIQKGMRTLCAIELGLSATAVGASKITFMVVTFVHAMTYTFLNKNRIRFFETG